MFIDTHSHLYDEAFDTDRDEVISRARNAGAIKVFLPNINAATVEPMLSLAQQNPGFLYPMIGLHPEDIGDDWNTVLDDMEALLAEPEHPFIAVGEVGLDYYWDRSRYEEQQQVFARQIDWAVRYRLPLMIHSRKAHRELVTVLKNSLNHNPSSLNPPLGAMRRFTLEEPSPVAGQHGVFHCFSGSEEVAEELLSTFPGFMLGIGGVLTFKNSHLGEVLRNVVPLSRIVLETDAPYLAPAPHRGKRNEPALIPHVVERLADIYGVSAEEVAAETTQNALNTFPKCQ